MSRRVVVDANQTVELARDSSLSSHEKGNITAVLPPLAWAEALLAPRADEWLPGLTQYDLRFGFDYSYVLQALCRLNEQGLESYVPLVPIGTAEHARLSSELKNPTAEGRVTAQGIKDENWQGQQELARRAARLRGRHKARLSSIDEAMGSLGEDTARSLLAKAWKRGGREGGPPQSLCQAVLRNTYLGRWARIRVSYSVGYVARWRDGTLNIPAMRKEKKKEHDLSDMALGLYVNDGDVLLTADSILRRHFSHCEPRGRAAAMTWDDFTAKPSG